MAANPNQLDIMKKVEKLFLPGSGTGFGRIEKGLLELGFVQKGGDPAIAVFENRDVELLIDVELNEDGKLHGYEIFPFEDLDKRQRKFRW